MEPFDLPVAPHWVTFFQYAGIVAGALIPLSLVFKRVRQWIKRQWSKFRSMRVSRAEVSHKVETLRSDMTKAIEDLAAMLISEIRQVSTEVKEVIQMGTEVKSALERVGLMESMLRIAADRDEAVGTIYCDQDGEVTFVSRSIAQWCQASRSDFTGRRWLNYVLAAEREAVRAEMVRAKADHRELRMMIHMGPHGTSPRPYMLILSPMPDSAPVRAWSGHLTPQGHDPNEKDFIA